MKKQITYERKKSGIADAKDKILKVSDGIT